MQNLATQTAEVVDVHDMVETDIFKKLMISDGVSPKDFLTLCDEMSREIGQYRSSSAA